ncbi:Patellin-4 [Forsythia ovata]|uniref:Patellin-4 n=1 Tax=Forsythia ovata TaxID=205694 RepID=A0ABD1VEU2_9LAMI
MLVEKVAPLDVDEDITTTNQESCDYEIFKPKSQGCDEFCTVEMKKLSKFRCRVEEAILGNTLFSKKKKKLFSKGNGKKNEENLKDITLWGVPLLPSKGHQGTDVVLMKFLKAKDYKVSDAFKMLRRMLKWRRDFGANQILVENFDPRLENTWLFNGKDKVGRPMWYNVLVEFVNKKSGNNFNENKEEFLKCRVHCLEKGIQSLDFKPGGLDSIVLITDLKNAPGHAMNEVRWISKKMLMLLHDNYPGIVHKNFIINVPAWFLALHALNLRLITQKSKNKFVFVKASKVTETLLKYATPQNLLVQYGGLMRESDTEFSTDDNVLELNARANTTERIQIPVNEAEVTMTWDVTVVGYEVSYKEEFIPEDDCSYKVLLQNEKKMGASIRNSFHIREPGKIVITIGNWTFKKKKVFYRYKSRPSVPMYMLIK